MFLAHAFFPRRYTQNAKKKTYFFFEHKGTRIFETNKSLFYKKHDIHPFLNYPIFFMNEMPVFPYIFLFDHPIYPGEHNDLSGSSTRAFASAHTNARTPSHERSHQLTRAFAQPYTNAHMCPHEPSCTTLRYIIYVHAREAHFICFYGNFSFL